ncbi:glycosyl transferase family 1 [Burkholderia territorii]|uniref:Glycosyl transferase family 1 n=1 Tax=Burkholderia territorii TaxID=1503055 RepID=A0A106DTI5_9BURK|nr:glycosyltransferase [Burkholderia territorii]KVV37268.1 glycosyl transferase family 1 [Burkholderia territorii]KVX34901.1 glycosyl transferase family 1 [Burkholderia territorii]
MSRPKFRVLLLDTKYRNPNHYICLAIFHALQRHPDVDFVVKVDPVDAIATAMQRNCDLFIAFDGEELRRDLCAVLATICGRSVLWVTEDPYELPINLRNAELFDVVFTNDSSSVSAYGNRGRHLPLAGAVDFHSLPVLSPQQEMRYHIFFAGTAWPNRSQFLRSVLKQLPDDWKFKLALPTNPFLPPHGIDLPPSALSWRTSPSDFARFANRSAITLMLPRVFTASGGREFAETPPPRLFEAALAGSVQIIHESLTEAKNFFNPEKELIFFSDERDFIEKTTRIINDRAYRNEIAEAARKKAIELHTYDRRVDTILTAASEIDAAPVRSAIADRRTVLFVGHNVIGSANFGGVEVYLDRIRHALQADYRVLFYIPDNRTGRSAQLLSETYEVLETINFSRAYSTDLLRCEEREDAFRNILRKYKIDLVHFHHFIGHPPSLTFVSRLLGISSAFTAHDFYGACHEFNLLSFKQTFCGAPNIPLSQCDVCLWQKHHIAPGSQALRRNFWNDTLSRTDMLVFNTEHSKETYERIYPAVRTHSNVQVLPVPIPDSTATAAIRHHTQPKPLKIAWLGNITHQKGGDVLSRALPLLAHAPVEFHLFGRIDPQYANLSDRTRYPNVVVHGGYRYDAMPTALMDCDVSLHLSIWPETYCLTLSEALQIGLVPIVTDIGALGERIEHGVNGLKIAPDSEGDLIDAIHFLIDSPSVLSKYRSNISPALYAQVSSHVASLKGAYSKLLRNRSYDMPQTDEKLNLAEVGIAPHPLSWHHGTQYLPLGGKMFSGAIRKAHKLATFYKIHGVRPTLRIIANRIRAPR